MFIHINTEGVVIDATEEKKYITKNPTTGKKVITYNVRDAIGVMGSDDIIRQMADKVIEVGFYNVADVIPVSELPEDYEPNRYVYSNGEFEPYEGIAPKDARTLTQENEVLAMRANDTDDIIDDLLTNVIPSIVPGLMED